MEALNVLPAWSAPKGHWRYSRYQRVIETILERQMGYVVNGTVYFDTRAAEDFGSLGSLGRERMQRLGLEWRGSQ